MAGEKIEAARAALDRFLLRSARPGRRVVPLPIRQHPAPRRGLDDRPQRISDELGRVRRDGATALYDAVAEALPLLRSGRHRKKALLVISDGNDTSSQHRSRTLKQLIRESEALVYAIGMDAETTLDRRTGATPNAETFLQRRRPMPPSVSHAGRQGAARAPRQFPESPPGTRDPRRPPKTVIADEPPAKTRASTPNASMSTRCGTSPTTAADAPRSLRDTRDLDPATARIADELSKQYFLAYPSRGHRDGRWHTIRVETRDRSFACGRGRGTWRHLRGSPVLEVLQF